MERSFDSMWLPAVVRKTPGARNAYTLLLDQQQERAVVQP